MTLRTLLFPSRKSLGLLLLTLMLAACGGSSSNSSSNNSGGSTDSDRDGIADTRDQCPATPSSEIANSNGCSASQLDDDGDGVSNQSDSCPATPSNTDVDAQGCAITVEDADGDGVADANDSCPATPAGESVDTDGCSASQLDDDNDGVNNSSDNCPNTAASATVDANGCSNSQNGDNDGDGVGNAQDFCPLTPAGASVDQNGCSDAQRDDDGDGVSNGQDDCPATPATETANVQGCSPSQLDDDNDGVNNADDICPNTTAGATVDSEGCSNVQKDDNDGDGVLNGNDQCPNTPPGTAVEADGCPPATITDGISYDVNLASNVDGENIAFTLHEPTSLSSEESYPLILHSHGYSGSRQSSRPTGGLLKALLDEGFYVLSLDERGHGDSGGTIRILDPDLEGKDWLKVLDWAEENLSQLAYADNGPTPATEKDNPLIGAVGGSYGGGYQLMIYAIDPEHRLDAIAPDITWNDLRYSLYPNDVFKTFWASVLSAGGNLAGNQDQEVNEGLATGLAANTLADDKLALLYRHSPASHCADENDTTADGSLRSIDAFITQSHMDTLFNFNDAYRNYRCLSDQGGDVRLFTKAAGHGIDSGDGQSVCGRLNTTDTTVSWFQEKLQFVQGAADEIPEVCFNLGSEGNDGIVLNDVPYGGDNFAFSSPLPIIAHEANLLPTEIELYTAQADNEVIAGVPTISLSMSIADQQAGAPLLEPIVFVGLAIRESGDSNPLQAPTPLMNQVTPFRGFGDHNVDLVGVMSRMQNGDKLVLMVYGSYPSQYATSASPLPIPVQISGSVAVPLLAPQQTAP